jgi:hypothetical protein
LRNTLKLLLERGIRTAAICLLLATAAIARAQVDQIDPTSQIQWNLGVVTTLPNCTQNGQYSTFPYGSQWGQHAIVSSTNLEWICTPSGWTSAQGCGANNTIANGCTGASTANGAVNNLLAPEVYLSGSASSGTLAAKLASATANTKIILQSNYSETLTSTATVNAANVTLQCNPGATLTLGANVTMISIPTAGNGATISNCTLNQGSATGQLVVAASSETTSSNVSILGNIITCGTNPFCIQAFNSTGFSFTNNIVTTNAAPLLLSANATGFKIDYNTITISPASGSGSQMDGIEYLPGVIGEGPTGGHVGWNTIYASGPNTNCIGGGGYSNYLNGLTWGKGEIWEGNKCYAQTAINFCYTMVVEQAGTMRDNACFANHYALLSGYEMPYAHGMNVTGNKCFDCENVPAGIWLDNDAEDNEVSDNYIYGFSTAAINFQGSTPQSPTVKAQTSRNHSASNHIWYSIDTAIPGIWFSGLGTTNTPKALDNKGEGNYLYGCPNVYFPSCTTNVNTIGIGVLSSGSTGSSVGQFDFRNNHYYNLGYQYDYYSYGGVPPLYFNAGDEQSTNVTYLTTNRSSLVTSLNLVTNAQLEGPSLVTGSNQIPNGTFAAGSSTLGTYWTGLTGNSGTATFLRDDTTTLPGFPAGTYAQKITLTGNGSGSGYASIESNQGGASKITFVAGSTYQVSFSALNDGSGILFTWWLTNGSTTYCTPKFAYPTISGITVTTTCMALASGTDGALEFYTNHTLGSLWIYNVSVTPLVAPTNSLWSDASDLPLTGAGKEICSGTGNYTSGDLVSIDANSNCIDSLIPLANVLTSSSTRAPSLNAGTATALAATPTSATGHVSCWKASGVFGYCSTVVDVSGNCTCN